MDSGFNCLQFLLHHGVICDFWYSLSTSFGSGTFDLWHGSFKSLSINKTGGTFLI
jgi:hypothetical protein